jgi:GNAT superfamily N-acetyltransferase
MTPPDIVIDYLANHPGLVGELARLSWREWQEVYQRREQTLEDSLKNYRERMNINRLPLTLVAVRALRGESLTGRAANCSTASELDFPIARPASLVTLASVGDSRRKVWRTMPNAVGMVSLKFHDMDTRPDLDPWLGGLLVLPEWRNLGVGTMLMHRATEEARRLNVPRLFLWTASAEGLYLKLGWRAIERTDYCGQRIVIMQKDPEENRT